MIIMFVQLTWLVAYSASRIASAFTWNNLIFQKQHSTKKVNKHRFVSTWIQMTDFNNQPPPSSPTLEELFGRQGVKFIDEGDDTGYLFSNKRIVEIPLMPFISPLFPGAREMLHIYEMKYRLLMSHSEETFNKTIGRCYVSPNGNIGAIGSLCRIKEKKMMNDGQGFYVIEAINRIKIRRVLKTEPYVMAEVELDYDDHVPSISEAELCETLCFEVYRLLKTYLRLARLRSMTEEGKVLIELSPAIRDSRPGQIGMIESDYGVQRHVAFSNACAQLLATEPNIMQQMLQSCSTSYRLHGIKRILEEAISELSSLLIDDDMLVEEEFQAIQEASLSGDDEDLMPPDDYTGIKIVDELKNSLNYELGYSLLDEEFSLEYLESQLDEDIAQGEENEQTTNDSLSDGENSTDESTGTDNDDDWDNLDAFQ